MKELDELDRQILQALRRDGRHSYTDMANTFGVSEGTIRLRGNRMLKNQIFRFTTETAVDKPWLSTGCIIGLSTMLGYQEEVVQQLRELECVRFISAFSGR